MTLRVNIVREYGSLPKEIVASRMDDKKLKSLKSLAYASSFYTEKFGLNLFECDGEEFERKTGLEFDGMNTLSGKTKYGFRTSRLERGIKWFFNSGIESNDGEQIRLAGGGRDFDYPPRVFNKQDKETDDDEETTDRKTTDAGTSDKESGGFTADALKKSRKIRKEFLDKFGIEGKSTYLYTIA